MHRNDLLKKLCAYLAKYPDEEASVSRFCAFVRETEDCFKRSHAAGHVTGSAWLLDPTGKKVLLTHHKKLQKWIQLGGHADGNANTLEVALKEAMEESGIQGIVPVSEEIFDLDIHLIPQNKKEAAHFHYDVRYALQVNGDPTFHVSGESLSLAWIALEDLGGMDLEESVLRMSRKWAPPKSLD